MIFNVGRQSIPDFSHLEKKFPQCKKETDTPGEFLNCVRLADLNEKVEELEKRLKNQNEARVKELNDSAVVGGVFAGFVVGIIATYRGGSSKVESIGSGLLYGGVGYLVANFLGGVSLKKIEEERNDQNDK